MNQERENGKPLGEETNHKKKQNARTMYSFIYLIFIESGRKERKKLNQFENTSADLLYH